MKLTPREPAPNEHRSCPSHCCPIHGCKYGHDDCPVATGKVPPQYPNNNGCEYCEFDATHAAPSGWQPIETAPDGVMLLFADMKAAQAKDWAFCGWRHNGLRGNFVQMPDSTSRSATHWMPLPAPPSEQTQAAPSVPSVEKELLALRGLVADDAWCCTFQTLGQVRTALLKEIDAAIARAKGE